MVWHGDALLRDAEGASRPSRSRRCQGGRDRVQDRRPRGGSCQGSSRGPRVGRCTLQGQIRLPLGRPVQPGAGPGDRSCFPRRDLAGGRRQAGALLFHVRSQVLLDEAHSGFAPGGAASGRGRHGREGSRVPGPGRRDLREKVRGCIVRGQRGSSLAALGVMTLMAVGGCRSDRPAAAPLTTAALTQDSVRPQEPHRIREVTGLSHPESARYDPDLDLWFVANINGDPLAKDNNGFITRLKSDGSIGVLKFAEGGRNGVRLNGPKGMAIVGDTLWVADIDAVRGFNRRTGAEVASVSLSGQAKFLNDIAAGPD